MILLAAGGLLAAAAALYALFIFLYPRPPSGGYARGENIEAARSRLLSLRGRDMPDAEFAEYEAEIKRRLLEEAESSDELPEHRPGADIAGIAVVCGFFIPAALSIYFYLGSPFVVAAPHPDLTEKIAALRAHIARNPEDAEALALMGRVMAAMGRDGEALEYFSRAALAEKSGENKNDENVGGE